MVEIALVAVNAVTKVEVQTERVWKRAKELGVARIAAVNMMDKERADFGEAVEALSKRFGDEVVAIGLPIGKESGFNGIVDLVSLKAYSYAGAAARGTEVPIPADMQDAVSKGRDALMDRVAEADDALLEKYLEGQELLYGRDNHGAQGRPGGRYGIAGGPGGGDQEHRHGSVAGRCPGGTVAGGPWWPPGLGRRERDRGDQPRARPGRPGGAVRVQDHLRPVLGSSEPGEDTVGQDHHR